MTPEEFAELSQEERHSALRELLAGVSAMTGASIGMLAVVAAGNTHIVNSSSRETDPEQLAIWRNAATTFGEALAKESSAELTSLGDAWKDSLT